MQREELRSELIRFLEWSCIEHAEVKVDHYLSQRDGTFIVDAGDNGVRMSLSKQDSGTNFVEDIEKDNEPKHLHIIPCDFCDNNRHVIDGKNYCENCYEKRYIKRKTKPDWCECMAGKKEYCEMQFCRNTYAIESRCKFDNRK